MGSIEGEIIPIDGKTLRGSYDLNKGQSALHTVTAWASEQRLVLGQVTFSEDQCRIRSEHSPENFALLRRLALNILHQQKTFKRSLRQKKKQAAMNNKCSQCLL